MAAAEQTARRKLTVEAVLRLRAAHKEPVWSDRSSDQILQHMEDYIVPVIGDKGIAEFELADAPAVVDPLLAKGKVETARRVRQRLSQMLDYAAAHRKVNNNVVQLAAHDFLDRFNAAHRAHPDKSHPTIPMEELPQLCERCVPKSKRPSHARSCG